MNENFKKLGIVDEMIEIIEKENFTRPTDIQKEAIPKILNGESIVCGAPTGSGKTLVYLSRIMDIVNLNKGVQALVLVPTRELAIQVREMTEKFSEIKNFNICSMYGGSSFNREVKELENAEVVIATPARVLHHIKEKTVNFDKLKILILDEVDILLSTEMRIDLEKVIENTPKTKQMALFSATINSEITRLAQKYVKKSSKVLVGKQVDFSRLKQVYYELESDNKLSLLTHLIKYEPAGYSLVFVNREELVKLVYNNLKIKGMNIAAVYADMSQGKREKILKDFKAGKIDVLITTDIYSRGLDILGISHIYNYSLPKDAKTYVHRVGRATRGDISKGKVISLVTRKDIEKFVSIVNENAYLPVRKKLPEFEKVKLKEVESQKDYNKKLKTYRKK